MTISSFFNFASGNTLLARCFRGGAVLTAGSAFDRGLRFIVNMILARLLAPDQFGLMALVLAATAFFETLTEVGVRQSVIQNKKGDTREFLNVAWWFSGVRGGLLYILGVAAAPWVAKFYAEPAIVPLLRVAFLTMLFNGLTNPSLYVLEKKLQFGHYVWIMQGSAAAGTLLCLGMAIWSPSVWALVVGVVAQAFLRCLGSFFFCPVQLAFEFDRQAWKEIFCFSRGMVGLPILTYLFMQADILFLGRMVDKDTLGLYSMAFILASTPQILVLSILGPMVLPVLSDVQDSYEQLRRRLLQMTRVLFMFGLPMTMCLAVFAESFLLVVYGRSEYARVSGAFAFLSFYVLLYLSGVLIASSYIALGRPDVHRQFTIARVLIMAIVLYPSILWFGPTGAAGARVACLILAGIVQQVNLSRLIDLPITHYLLTFKEGLILSVLIVLPAFLLRHLIETPFLQLIAAIGLCGLAWLYILWSQKESIQKLVLQKNPSVTPEGSL